MKKLINFFVKLRKKIATFFVIAVANHAYKRAVKQADELHNDPNLQGDAFYVAYSFDTRNLKVYNRERFRVYKGFLITAAARSKKKDAIQNLLLKSMSDIDKGCFYRTAHRSNTNPLPRHIIERKRLAYIDFVLRAAKLK